MSPNVGCVQHCIGCGKRQRQREEREEGKEEKGIMVIRISQVPWTLLHDHPPYSVESNETSQFGQPPYLKLTTRGAQGMLSTITPRIIQTSKHMAAVKHYVDEIEHTS